MTNYCASQQRQHDSLLELVRHTEKVIQFKTVYSDLKTLAICRKSCVKCIALQMLTQNRTLRKIFTQKIEKSPFSGKMLIPNSREKKNCLNNFDAKKNQKALQ